MATQPAFDKPVSVEEYLSMEFEHDCEYVDGVIEERDLGGFEHSFLQLFLGSIFVGHRADWGVIAVSEQRVQLGQTGSAFPIWQSCALGLPKSLFSPIRRCW